MRFPGVATRNKRVAFSSYRNLYQDRSLLVSLNQKAWVDILRDCGFDDISLVEKSRRAQEETRAENPTTPQPGRIMRWLNRLRARGSATGNPAARRSLAEIEAMKGRLEYRTSVARVWFGVFAYVGAAFLFMKAVSESATWFEQALETFRQTFVQMDNGEPVSPEVAELQEVYLVARAIVVGSWFAAAGGILAAANSLMRLDRKIERNGRNPGPRIPSLVQQAMPAQAPLPNEED